MRQDLALAARAWPLFGISYLDIRQMDYFEAEDLKTILELMN